MLLVYYLGVRHSDHNALYPIGQKVSVGFSVAKYIWREREREITFRNWKNNCKDHLNSLSVRLEL